MNIKDLLFLNAVPTDDKSINTLFQNLDIDFPAMARIPLFMLRKSLKKALIKAVYFTDGTVNYGYAVYQINNDHSLMHVLYLAILPPYRSFGLGGRMLTELGKLIEDGCILLDAEDPDKAKTPKEKEKCLKRIHFYKRNGFSIYPKYQFKNFGFYLRVLYKGPIPKLDLEKQYQILYNNAYGLNLSAFCIKGYR